MHKVTSRTSLTEKGKTDEAIENGSGMNLDSWRRSVNNPTRYRIGNASIHLKASDLLKIFISIIVIFVIIITLLKCQQTPTIEEQSNEVISDSAWIYDKTYPLTRPYEVPGGVKYRIGLVTDLDHDSKVEKSLWQSFLLKGYLTVYKNKTFDVELDPSSRSIKLLSSLAQGGRGMELSELVVFDGRLITVDDRTGVVYEILNEQAVTWVILPDGNGEVAKGFKAEWATVKDRNLYVGGLGKEWTSSTGQILNNNPQYVKRIEPDGTVEHIDWHKFYNKMKLKAGFPSPGYMIHEAAVWSDVHRRWFFLPRRASTEPYDDKLDEKRAANILISCDERFTDIKVTAPFGPFSQTHGFSSFKFIPMLGDQYIIALKSEEDNGHTASYMMILDVQGNVLMPEKHVGNHKFEGVEFI